MRFQEKRGWYEVEEEVAEALRPLRQPALGRTPEDATPAAFDVMENAAAVAMEEAERVAKEERAKAVSPHRMTPAASAFASSDLKPAEKEAEEEAEDEASADEGTKRGVRAAKRRSSRDK